MPLVPNELELRRRFNPKYFDTLKDIRSRMSSLVYLSWLSVYRELIEDDDEYDYNYRARRPIRVLNPIDSRLRYLLSRLRDYHLKIQSEANALSVQFQKQVLISLLYSDQFDTYDFESSPDVNFQELHDQLYDAYKALDVLTSGLRKRIDEHTEIIKKSIETIQKKSAKKEYLNINDVLPLSLLKRTRKIVSLSNKTDIKKNELFQLLNLFVDTVNNFFHDKILNLNPASEYGFEVYKNSDPINFLQLSSGEKQLFILLAETLLQNSQNAVFIADEPELSLHISWQRKLLKAIRKLNPNSQLIVATHSPEIAGEPGQYMVFSIEYP